MTWGIRSCALAAGAAALLSAQAAYAAPAPARSNGIDPLVSLSVMGTDQSRAAVCGSATFDAASCGVATAPVIASTAASAAAAQDVGPGKSIGPWAFIIGLGILAAIIAVIASSSNNNSSGDLTPVSPM